MSTPIDCQIHGRFNASVVCCHMIGTTASVGFVENSSDPEDLQAWCHDCEAMFLAEGGMTDAFVAFNDMAIVCARCYHSLRQRHWIDTDD